MSMNYYSKREHIVKATLTDGSTRYIFPVNNSIVISAESRLKSAVGGTGRPFVTAHQGTDRDSVAKELNASRVLEYEHQVVDVPTSVANDIDSLDNLLKDEEGNTIQIDSLSEEEQNQVFELDRKLNNYFSVK